MNDSPRLCVEDALLLALVVVGRILVNIEERYERHRPLLAQQKDVVADYLAERHLAIILYVERAVVFGQPLVEPERHAADAVIYKQVNVFVKDDAERIV